MAPLGCLFSFFLSTFQLPSLPWVVCFLSFFYPHFKSGKTAGWHEGCSENRRGTAKRDRKRQTPKGGRRLAPHSPLLKSLCGGGVPSSHPSLGLSVFFLSFRTAAPREIPCALCPALFAPRCALPPRFCKILLRWGRVCPRPSPSLGCPFYLFRTAASAEGGCRGCRV